MSTDIDCPYYHHGLFIGSTPNGQTQMSMCCWQSKTTVDNAVTFDHVYLESIRTQSTTQIPKECSQYCSMPGHVANERERATVEWATLFKNIPPGAIKTLHLEQSLTCNLTCISCSSNYSTAWNRDYHRFDSTFPRIQLAKFPEEKWRDLDLQHLEKLHFTGGEPLLNRDNKKILQHLLDIGRLGNVMLSYNTNGTVFPDQETLDLWSKCRFVRLFFSLDGVDSVFEYTRYPAKWNEVESNIQQFRALTSTCVLIEVNAIVGIHNIFGLPEFFNWWENNCQSGSQGDPSSIFVRTINGWSHGGRVLDLASLSNEQANKAVSMLQSLNKYPGVPDLINYITTHNRPNKDWVTYLDTLDSIRGTNWKKDLPC